ncbi:MULTISPECIES: O-acetylhomoserine aminocarboxypropyltransferase/cysteine synthase family protein [unclassified Arthrobacter]|uniref:O-acetylhomoserine aminocarboxypropyltransferase/cysteine synthase family protein n=1 Tax=unclassified Arthrobacter TaxID=235627 RepID=UPI0008A48316|nr:MULTISPECIES: PLP-dependent transferase [unclassified Arthrobacter]OFT23661.1 O-acetylhomoserine aminocarboxypropyltransferase [Arthrobacter sp. HMSC08H08]OFT41579.1 O-acetylhomoserine aminocarboxypropyltransferase [Arthrobacter sp. HMSC06H05]
MSQQKFETRQIHAGQTPDPTTGSQALPIHLTNAYVFPDTEAAANRFALSELGPIYTRLGNPTTEVIENRMASLEGGVGALFVASGMAATSYAILNVAEAGDHIVASPSLYGGTQNLFKHTLPKLGVEVTFVEDPDDLDAWRGAIKPNTKAFFGETIGNPRQDVFDIENIAAIAHDEAGVPLIIDNTLATPYSLRPIEWGADVVVHSATKYLCGHGTAMGGVIIDSGNFDYTQHPERFPGFNQPDESYHGIVYGRDMGVGSPLGANLSYILKIRVQLLRDTGAAISPMNSFLIAQGLETLSLRVERHIENAQKVAQWLEARDDVSATIYAGLESCPWYERGRHYAPEGVGAIVSFEIKGAEDNEEAARAFVDALELHSLVANLGDVRSLVAHPSSTTHSQLSPEEKRAAGVGPGTVRLSVGLEHVDDIIADLQKGFDAFHAARA